MRAPYPHTHPSHKFIFGLGNAIPEREAAAVALARAPPAAVTTPSVSVKTAASHASRERDLGADEANPLKPSTFNQLWTPEEHVRVNAREGGGGLGGL